MARGAIMTKACLIFTIITLYVFPSSSFISNVGYNGLKVSKMTNLPILARTRNPLQFSSISNHPKQHQKVLNKQKKEESSMLLYSSLSKVSSMDASMNSCSPLRKVEDVSTNKGVSSMVKVVMLSTLVLQNAGTSLLSVYVRKQTHYDGAAVSLIQEVGKIPLILGMFAVLKSHGHANETYTTVWRETFSWKAFELALPALCFAGQNVLYFTSLSHIDAATYSILSQSKTAFTAFFFVTLLGRTLNAAQVLALSVLTVGMGLVQLGPSNAAVSTMAPPTTTLLTTSAVIGISAALASSLFSGLATILFEKQAKRKEGSLCAKQIQLVSWTSFFTAFEIIRRSGVKGLLPSSLCNGWTSAVWSIVFLKTFGGMLTATSIRLTDNMVKTFATAAAIVITAVASPPSILMRGNPFIAGIVMVMGSAFMYARASR